MRQVSTPSALATPALLNKRVSEGVFILTLAVASFLLLSLVSEHGVSGNAGGPLGALFARSLLWMLGYVAFMLPPSLIYLSWVILQGQRVLPKLDEFALALRGAFWGIGVVS